MLHFDSSTILIDKSKINKDVLWLNDNEKIEFEKNKNVVDPKYLENDIHYKFNKQGYRTKDLDKIDNNFVLVFGCSHTEGVGLHNEDIWCNQLCKRIDIDCINLGKSGSGPDIQYINSLQYIKNNYPKPKLVIIQWPQMFRRSFAYLQNTDIVLQHHNVNSKVEKQDTNWFLKRYCGNDSSEMFMNNYISFNATNMLWNSINVPVYNWSWIGDFDFKDSRLNIVETVDTGRARDMMHDGADIHKQVVDKIYKDIDKML